MSEFEIFQNDPFLWGAIYSPESTDGMTGWEASIDNLKRLLNWIGRRT